MEDGEIHPGVEVASPEHPAFQIQEEAYLEVDDAASLGEEGAVVALGTLLVRLEEVRAEEGVDPTLAAGGAVAEEGVEQQGRLLARS